MVACPKCVVNNTLDSAFCKKCGATLPISVIEEEQAKLKEIVTKGMESYQAGNLEEALAISEHSILTNPSFAEAYALKGLIHERKGEYAEALDSYETVVALNPDSTIDKIKLNQLRNAFAQRQAGEPKADRKGAAILAFGVTGFVAACGVIIYGVILNSKETKDVQNTNLPVQSRTVSNQTNQGGNMPNPNLNQVQRDPNRPNQTSDPNDVKALGGADNNPAADRGPSTSGGSRFNSSGRRGGYGPSYDDIEPVNPNIQGGIGSGGSTKTLPNPNGSGGTRPNNNAGNGDDPGVTPNGGNSITPSTTHNGIPVAGNTTKDPDKDNGVYQISASTNGGGNGTSRNTGESGGNSGRQFQRQAQGLKNAGKTSEARAAYQKAIDAYEKEINSGKGDKDAAQAGLNSSKQALKNLKD